MGSARRTDNQPRVGFSPGWGSPHSVILEMTGLSIRIEQAQAGRTNEGGNEQSVADPTTADSAPTTTTPTTTTEGTSTTTPHSPTTITPLTDNPIPGAAPMAPGPATATNHQRTKGGPTNDRRETIKQRVQQQSERDGEM
jgi:hypothetical protein